MTEQELQATIQGYLTDARTLGDLTSDMASTLDYYYGRDYGNEIKGRSQVVTREVMEVVEAQMPELMRIFAGDDAVEFRPVAEDDIEPAKQETKVIRNVAFEQNDGFTNIYNWIKDGALQRVGYARVWVEEEEDVTEQTLTLTPDQRLMLRQEVDAEDDLEVIEDKEEDEDGFPVHKVTVAKTETRKSVKWGSVPPEEIRVVRDASSVDMDEMAFCAQVRNISQSELIQMGYDRDVIESLPAYGEDDDRDAVDYARATHSGEDGEEMAFVEQSMRPIQVSDCFLSTDYDDDGIAELRFVRYAGNKILENKEADMNEFIAWCPMPMPHQHVGLSLADPVMDLQLQNSTLMRQVFDNLFLTNAPMREVQIDMIPPQYMDLHTKSVPGGMLPTKKIGSIAPVTVPFTAAASVPIMDVLDKQKERRTGVSMSMQGLDPNVLARSTEGAFMGAMEKNNARLELVARLFAENGLKKLFGKIHALLVKHQDKDMTVNISGQFLPVNPSEWKRRTDMTVLIGTGNATTMQKAATAKSVIDLQERIIQAGGGGKMVMPENVYNAASDFVGAIGKRGADRYFQDPSKLPPAPPQEEPKNPLAEAEMVKAQAKMQSDQMKAEVDMRLEAMKQQHQAEMARMEATYKAEIESVKQRKDTVDAERDRQSKTEIEAARIAADREMKAVDAQYKSRELELEAEKIAADREIKLAELEVKRAAAVSQNERDEIRSAIELLKAEREEAAAQRQRDKDELSQVVIAMKDKAKPKTKVVKMSIGGKEYTADVEES